MSNLKRIFIVIEGTDGSGKTAQTKLLVERLVLRSNGNRMDVSRSNKNRMEPNGEQIILKEESYRLMGLLFEIQNKLGSSYKERNYQDAIEGVLKREKIPYEREKRFVLKLDNLDISDFIADFVIENKIILEVKATSFITQEDIRQVLRYLKSLNVPLAIIANFRGKELEYKRITNPLFGSDSEQFGSNSSVIAFDFPQYGQPSAYFAESYLNGKYGTAEEVGPERASLFYALDRYEASFALRQALTEGNVVVANRYVGSNLAHQGGKIQDAAARKKFFEWGYKLEYEMLGIPKPDVSLVLHVPAAMAQALVLKKGERAYLNGAKRDIHEADLNHLKHAEEAYLEMVRLFPKDFVLLECVEKGKLLSIDEIHERIWQVAERFLLNPRRIPRA